MKFSFISKHPSLIRIAQKHIFTFCFLREEVKEQLEKKKKGSKALAEFEEKMNEVCTFLKK